MYLNCLQEKLIYNWGIETPCDFRGSTTPTKNITIMNKNGYLQKHNLHRANKLLHNRASLYRSPSASVPRPAASHTTSPPPHQPGAAAPPSGTCTGTASCSGTSPPPASTAPCAGHPGPPLGARTPQTGSWGWRRCSRDAGQTAPGSSRPARRVSEWTWLLVVNLPEGWSLLTRGTGRDMWFSQCCLYSNLLNWNVDHYNDFNTLIFARSVYIYLSM